MTSPQASAIRTADAPVLIEAVENLSQIRIVMVNTTLAANIGAAARALKTMGLMRLILVAPKHFPSPEATALAAGAVDLLNRVEVVDSLEAAIADCHLVFGTSARSRTMPWPLLDVREAMALAQQNAQQGQQIAIVFGREDRGLTNDELALCHYHVSIPSNPSYGVLNVAAAIQIVSYELRMHALLTDNLVPSSDESPAAYQMPVISQMSWDEPVVDQASMQQFHRHLEQMLTDIDFLDPKNPRLLPLRLKRLFARIRLDQTEYNLLRGVFGRVQALRQGQWPPASLRQRESTDV